VDDVFRCILDKWKKELNLLDIEEKQTIKIIDGEKICQTVVDRGNPVVPPDGFGWTLVKSLVLEYFDVPPFNQLPTYYESEYCRFPGRAVRYLPAPHRPVRAAFPHTVPLNWVSLLDSCDKSWA